jgi:hypothetical protein
MTDTAHLHLGDQDEDPRGEPSLLVAAVATVCGYVWLFAYEIRKRLIGR